MRSLLRVSNGAQLERQLLCLILIPCLDCMKRTGIQFSHIHSVMSMETFLRRRIYRTFNPSTPNIKADNLSVATLKSA
mgnify:CR=1 FL=1